MLDSKSTSEIQNSSILTQYMEEYILKIKSSEDVLIRHFSDVLQKGIDKTIFSQCNGKGSVKYITLSLLLSSFITKQNTIMLNFWDDTLYLDSENVYVGFTNTFINKYIDDIMDKWKQESRKQMLKISISELTEIDKMLAFTGMLQIVDILHKNMKKILEDIETSTLVSDHEIIFTFGLYMEKHVTLHTWEVRK